MKKVLYYHMYLTDEHASWVNIFHEQMDMIESSGLLKNLDEIKITAICQPNSDHQRILVGLLREFDGPEIFVTALKNPYPNDKTMTQNIEDKATVTENATICKIYKDTFENVDQDYAIGYIHNKGITRMINDVEPHSATRYYYWRQFLNYGVIEKWQDCIDALKRCDIAGVNLQQHPELHYSGNFWWARASHIRKLPDPSTLGWWKTMKAQSRDHWLQSCSDRFRDEMWPCSISNTKAFNVHPYSDNPASVLVKRSTYISHNELQE